MDDERLKMARAKLATDPYNLDSWEVIARDGQTRRIDEARKIFEEVVETFPTSGKFWKMYIEIEVTDTIPYCGKFRHLGEINLNSCQD
jgi:cleavage stimulation factor subunit 3